VDFSKLDRDAESLVEAANALRSKIAELKLDSDTSRSSNVNKNDETFRVRYRKH
jgi:hypothetical protein